MKLTTMNAPVLQVTGLSRAFGGLVVAADINLSLCEGDRVALIGPNGAGKTTFVNLVSGALSPSAGAIKMAGENLTPLSDVQRVRRGLVRTFQISRLFGDMTLMQHVELAINQRSGNVGVLPFRRSGNSAVSGEASDLLQRLGLLGQAHSTVNQIAYGQQRLLEIALALALKPKVLLLDEPAAGVASSETGRIIDALDALPKSLAVLMIEHDMDLVFRFARRIVVLAAGKVICEGDPTVVSKDDRVRQAYLGSYVHAARDHTTSQIQHYGNA
jgi:branched-chain amino acid transport system ATP-binding protein